MIKDDSSSPGRPLDATDVLAPTTRLLGGKYRLGRMLGEGGMGAVYEAEHTGLGVNVAVKLLNELFVTDPNAVTRFRREARAAAAIRHANVVTVTDTGTDEDGVPFLVMELVEGESLSALLRRERVLSPTEAGFFALQLLAGLAAAHKKGVIHRDLKPGNVLVSELTDGTRHLKILDFGISKFFADTAQNVTATGAVVGTPRFMAPEQARGQMDLDGRVDIYAVGVLLYRMGTGKLPFTAQSQDEIIKQILSGKMRAPREVRPELPATLEAVILRAMAADRDQRYPDVHSFIEDLQAALPDLPRTVTVVTTTTDHGRTPTGASQRSTASAVGGAPTAAASPQALRTRANARAHNRGRRIIAAVVALALVGAGGWWLLRRSSTVTSAVAPGPQQGTGGAAVPAVDKGPLLRMGITRYLPRDQLRREHGPLVNYLSNRLQRDVKLVVTEDYVDLAGKLERGELELAALSSCDYVRAKRRYPGIKLLATHETRSGKSYQGHILTRADGGLDQLDHLRGKVFCYVNPKSCSGYLYPRAKFRQEGLDPDRDFSAVRFSGDHLRALRYLHSGACDGAAVFAGIFYEAEKHGLQREQFNIVGSTIRIPYDAYCVPESLSAQLAHSLREALLALEPASEAARQALGANSRITGFVPVADAAYDRVRALEKYLDRPPSDRNPQPHR